MTDDGLGGADGTHVRSRHDWSVDSAFEAVVSAVAVAADRDPVSLPPLYERVDPEALDALFASSPTGGAADGLCVTFAYEGYEVTIQGAGTVTVQGEGGRDLAGPR